MLSCRFVISSLSTSRQPLSFHTAAPATWKRRHKKMMMILSVEFFLIPHHILFSHHTTPADRVSLSFFYIWISSQKNRLAPWTLFVFSTAFSCSASASLSAASVLPERVQRRPRRNLNRTPWRELPKQKQRLGEPQKRSRKKSCALMCPRASCLRSLRPNKISKNVNSRRHAWRNSPKLSV